MYEMHREVSTSAKALGKPTEVQTEDFPLQCQYLEYIHFVGGVVQRSYSGARRLPVRTSKRCSGLVVRYTLNPCGLWPP